MPRNDTVATGSEAAFEAALPAGKRAGNQRPVLYATLPAK
jgi:hypothetical protein